MDPERKSLNFIFPTKYVIPKSLSRLAIGQVSKTNIFATEKCWLGDFCPFQKAIFYLKGGYDGKGRVYFVDFCSDV